MQSIRFKAALAGVVVAGLGSLTSAQADPQLTGQLDTLRQQIEQLQNANTQLGQELAEMRNQQHGHWLNERRAEEVKALVREVLSDADTRASLLDSPLTAGHDGKFFLASADGQFRLNISGQLQFRYIVNSRNDPPAAGTETESGFQFRRTRLVFDGHIGDPRITYRIQTEASRNGGSMSIADLFMGYRFDDNWALTFGRKKAPFLKEELHSSSRQLAVERSAVNAVFSGQRTTGVELGYRGDNVRGWVMVNDGFGTSQHEFNSDAAARVGLTGRVETKLAGEWGQHRDFIAWGSPFGLFIGAGGHYEHNRTNRFGGNFNNTLDFVSWTTDVALYSGHFSAFAAVVGRHDTDVVAGTDKYDDFGVLAQASYLVTEKIAPFVRYEWITPDDARNQHDIHLVTAGVNYYLNKHNAKLTVDVVWAPEPLNGFFNGSSGLGLLPDAPGQDDQVALRAQFQLLF